MTTGNIWGYLYEKVDIQVGSLDVLDADVHRKIRETLYKQNLCILCALLGGIIMEGSAELTFKLELGQQNLSDENKTIRPNVVQKL